MRYDWCGNCGGEMVSCECPEIVDDRDGPEEYDDEVVEDRNVIWTVGDNGVGRIEVVR